MFEWAKFKNNNTKNSNLSKKFVKAELKVTKYLNKLNNTQEPHKMLKYSSILNNLESKQLNLLNEIFKKYKLQRIDRQYLNDLGFRYCNIYYSTPIYSAAESLCKGYTITDLNDQTMELRQLAFIVCASFHTLKNIIVNHSNYKDENIESQLKTMLIQFDENYTKFEKAILSRYLSNRSSLNRNMDHVDWLASIIKIVIDDCLEKDIFNQDQIESFSPELMIYLPRLAMLEIMIKTIENKDENINIIYKKSQVDFGLRNLFNNEKFTLYKNCKLDAENLNNQELLDLEKLLINNESKNNIDLPSHRVIQCCKQICNLADSIHSSAEASNLMFSLEKAFKNKNFL